MILVPTQRSAWGSNKTFAGAAASMRLHLAAWDEGDDGVLRDVQVNLCEDLKTAMIWATHKNGSDLYASFVLPASTTEEQFDASEYVAALRGDEDTDTQGDKS